MDRNQTCNLPRNSSTTCLRRSTSIAFPTSPPPPIINANEQLVHFSHPQHLLNLLTLQDVFTCMGCKEFGAGNRFSCPQCDFQLHPFCASPPPFVKDHRLHSQHDQLRFSSKPAKGGLMRLKCDICWKTCKGYNFHCTACSFQMHPCCAMLSTQMYLSAVHPHTLLLLPTNNAESASDIFCGHCKRKRSGRVYRCPTCTYHIHAVCAKDMINGLHANGYKPGQETPSMMGSAARVASQVVVGLFGNLVVGIGEGVGEALIENMVKGKGTSTRSI